MYLLTNWYRPCGQLPSGGTFLFLKQISNATWLSKCVLLLIGNTFAVILNKFFMGWRQPKKIFYFEPLGNIECVLCVSWVCPVCALGAFCLWLATPLL